MFSPNFTITPKALNNLTEISEIKAIIERSRVLPEAEIHLRQQAMVKMAYSTTSIEGNPLAEFEVEKVLAGKKVSAEKKQILEVKNYPVAYKKMAQIAQEKENFSKKDILILHKLLTKGWLPKEKSGHYRPGPVYVANVENGKENIIYTAPPKNQVPKLIDNLLDWIKKAKKQNLHPIIVAGLLHYQFVTIHPFSDGNGRIARLLALLYLYQNSFDFKKILVLEDFYNKDRESYYKALDLGENYKQRMGVDLTSWLEYYTKGFLSEAKKVKEEIINMGFGKKTLDGEEVFLDKDEIKIMDFIATMGKITSSDVVDILSLPKRTAQAKIKDLVDKELLVKKGSGPRTYYIINS